MYDGFYGPFYGHLLWLSLDRKHENRCNPSKRVHLWLARMYAQMEKFVLASSTLETPCYAAPDLEAEELAELKSDLGSYYNALAKSLLGSSQMDSNKNPEESLKQGQHARKRAIAFLMACSSSSFSNSPSNPHSTVNKNHFFKSNYF